MRSLFLKTLFSGLKFRAVSLLGISLVLVPNALAQTSFTDVTATGAWNTARWNNSADGPLYGSTFTASNNVIFTTGNYSFAGMGSALNVGNITVNSGANVNFATIGSTFATGGNIRTIDVAAGSIFDFNGQALSTAAGTGFIKNGAGVLGTGGGNFTGGFTLNAGTVVARGTTGFGSGGSNTLTLNGGTVASNANRDFADTRFPGGITIGGNVQFGEFASNVSIASDSARVTFANDVSLSGGTRTLTIGNLGNHAFSGIISNGALNFAAASGAENTVSGNGRFDITNAANTFTGDIVISGAEVRFTADGSMGNASNDIIINGGRFGKASDNTTLTVGAGRNVFVGEAAGTSISSAGSGTLVINSAISDITGETGSWAKQGSGVLELGGVSTYTGSTAINNGTLRLTTGDNRLPTGTVVSIGQAGSANLGTLDLNGRNQEVAGLQSVAGTNATANTNVVTSAAAATLTVNNTANFVYGDGTAANSGVISGAISLVKEGTGTLTLGGTNTYTGTSIINGGTLLVNGSHTGGGLYTVNANGTLGGSGTIGADVNIAGGTLAAGNSIGTLTVDGNVTFTTGSIFALEFDSTNLTSDLFVVNGDVDLGGATLSLFDFAPATVSIGDSFTFLTYTGVLTGQFNGLDNGSITSFGSNQWQISYGAGSVSFAAVPEPSSMALIGLVGLGGVAIRRVRNKKNQAASEVA